MKSKENKISKDNGDEMSDGEIVEDSNELGKNQESTSTTVSNSTNDEKLNDQKNVDFKCTENKESTITSTTATSSTTTTTIINSKEVESIVDSETTQYYYMDANNELGGIVVANVGSGEVIDYHAVVDNEPLIVTTSANVVLRSSSNGIVTYRPESIAYPSIVGDRLYMPLAYSENNKKEDLDFEESLRDYKKFKEKKRNRSYSDSSRSRSRSRRRSYSSSRSRSRDRYGNRYSSRRSSRSHRRRRGSSTSSSSSSSRSRSRSNSSSRGRSRSDSRNHRSSYKSSSSSKKYSSSSRYSSSRSSRSKRYSRRSYSSSRSRSRSRSKSRSRSDSSSDDYSRSRSRDRYSGRYSRSKRSRSSSYSDSSRSRSRSSRRSSYRRRSSSRSSSRSRYSKSSRSSKRDRSSERDKKKYSSSSSSSTKQNNSNNSTPGMTSPKQPLSNGSPLLNQNQLQQQPSPISTNSKNNNLLSPSSSTSSSSASASLSLNNNNNNNNVNNHQQQQQPPKSKFNELIGANQHVEMKIKSLLTKDGSWINPNFDAKSSNGSPKMYLIVDIDHTLLHSTKDPNAESYYIKDNSINKFTITETNETFYVKQRPNAIEFLSSLSSQFKIYLYSFHPKYYVEQLALILDPNRSIFTKVITKEVIESVEPLPINSIGKPYIVFNNQNFSKIFNFEAVNQMIILDDREDVWRNFQDNLILLDTFKFFNTNSSNTSGRNDGNNEIQDFTPIYQYPFSFQELSKAYPFPNITEPINNNNFNNNQLILSSVQQQQSPSSFSSSSSLSPSSSSSSTTTTTITTNPSSNIITTTPYLDMFSGLLPAIQGEFLSRGDINTIHVKSIIDEIRSSVLMDCNIVFSGIFPKQIDPSKLCHTRVSKITESFGAKISLEIDSTTTHLIFIKEGTSKAQQALKNPNIKVVHFGWLRDCVHRWEKMDEQNYTVNSYQNILKTFN
ncbi:hypothetical protein ACTFIU_003801 [Dictyostelium citrinum]